MTKLMSYTMAVLLATIAVSMAVPSNDDMMAREKAAWQAFKDKNADGSKRWWITTCSESMRKASPT